MTSAESVNDVVIVGGGPAGAAAACRFAEAGCRQVLLVERTSEAHHKVCGEFLSIEAQRYLTRLGIDLDLLGASEISSVRVVRGHSIAEADLPFRARGLSRKILDEALLAQAAAAGATLSRGMTIRSIDFRDRSCCLSGDSSQLRARTVFLATGKHDLRGAKRPIEGFRDDLIGFKMHATLLERQQDALQGTVEILLFPGGYAGLQMIEGGLANLCLLISRQSFDAAGRSWSGLREYLFEHCPHLAMRLEGAVMAFSKPLAISHLPYGFVYAPCSEPEGLFRLGDQFAVIPSFTGDGMAIALHTGLAAATSYLQYGRRSDVFHRQLRVDIHRQFRIASLIHGASGRPMAQSCFVRLFQAWPAAMQHVAGRTRLSDAVIQRVLRQS
ncbi:NAD(P)/FAD-dependent oxidoreductase [Microvirga puerhi]|uniref:FAD-dependent oxidoreductase n=1 Tax=Microvirga puerhi TaxID=2876078 RepID=A0ABS7VPR6_9HYPH|nr:FAD-dependent oxidoreductase [Microvirga puerhi]